MKTAAEILSSPAIFRLVAQAPDGFAALVRTRRNILQVIASWGMGWDHVSVSAEAHCPTWGQMDEIKRLFFRDGETAMQLHVPPSEHVDLHPNCLHLWRPQIVEIPRPPAIMV